MKAWVLHRANDLQLNEVDMPELADNEVLVAVKAVGICGSDIPRIYQTGAHRHPLIPGHEFAGQVVAVGANADDKWLNKRVGVFPLIPCRKCSPCINKQYEMCRNYDYLGSRRDGGFAEYVAVPEDNLIELPDNVTFEEAAMLEPMAVAAHAIRRIEVSEADRDVVCGLATIGILLLMFLIEKGIKDIFVIGNKDFQKQTVLKMGLSDSSFCDSRTEDVSDWIMSNTDNKGADVFFECVGRNETVVQAVNLTAPAGRIMLIGNPYSDMKLDKNTYWKILRNQLTVKGTWNSSFTHEEDDDWNYVLKLLAQRAVSPADLISHRLTLDELESGLHIMRDKTEDYIKVMCVNK